jgi:hypothetical protein
MKQCFSHRQPSSVTLLSDPWPEDPIEIREKVEMVRKTLSLPRIAKAAAKSARKNQSPLK